jgi:dienelactone hydrolase
MNPELFKPAGTPNGGVITIAHGSDGLVDNARGNWMTMIREYAAELSQQGFTILLPDYFALTGTKPPETLPDYAANRDTWQNALAKVIADASTIKGIEASRIGLLGFSLGGHLVLRLRSTAKVLVSYFAPELDGLEPRNARPLQALLHHGKKDSLVHLDPNAIHIEATLKAEGASVELVRYKNAEHGFAGTDPDNVNAARESKAATLTFFASNLV